jgi:sugar O-acyltransferase (sialic acid O-acetyltransferase NeuD family)
LPSAPTKIRNCVIFGGGGHAKVVIECLKFIHDVNVRGILDNDKQTTNKTVSGIPVIGSDAMLAELVQMDVTHFVVGVGSTGTPDIRKRLFEQGKEAGLIPVTICHPSAICSDTALIGGGSQLMAGCIIQADACIGNNVIVNTGAIVEHDCHLGDNTHIATGARLAGSVFIAADCHIGAGATVLENLKLSTGVIVGAGAVVTKNFSGPCTIVGVPAKQMN